MKPIATYLFQLFNFHQPRLVDFSVFFIDQLIIDQLSNYFFSPSLIIGTLAY